jgi:hypothetical protein
MKVLRSVLYAQAAVWAGCGVAVAAFPHWVLQDLFDQPAYVDNAYVRVSGVLAIGFALMMVLVAQRLEDVWWWAWAFIITTAGVVTVTGLHALFGVPAGAGAPFWWLFAGINVAFLVGLMIGMAMTAQEKPFA